MQKVLHEFLKLFVSDPSTFPVRVYIVIQMLAFFWGDSLSSLVDLDISAFSADEFQASHGSSLIGASDKHDTSCSVLLEVVCCKSMFLVLRYLNLQPT